MSRQSCIKCRSVPNDILILECDHSMCVNCASKLCQFNNSCIKCPTCKHLTFLDEDIMAQIQQNCVKVQQQEIRRYCEQQKRYNQNKLEDMNIVQNSYRDGLRETISKIKNKQKKGNHNSCHNNNKSFKTNELVQQKMGQFQQTVGNRKTVTRQKQQNAKEQEKIQSVCSQSTLFYCKDHCQYQIMYICLQCQNVFICPQCIIHGTHHNHQVQTIKKAVSRIHAQLSSKIYALDCSIEGLIQASDDRKMKLRGKIQRINQLRQEAILKYKNIRQEIAKEQSEIIDKCDNLAQSFQRDFSQMQNWIKNDLFCIQREKDSINYILNPSVQFSVGNNRRKYSKSEQKVTELKIVEEYFNHLKRNDKLKNFLWLNNKQKQIECFPPKSEESLQMLTDRINRIKLTIGVPPPTLTFNQRQGIIKNLNNLTTKTPSLAASRTKDNPTHMINEYRNDKIQQNKALLKNISSQSPFNQLKLSFDRQNFMADTQSILIKGSRNGESRKGRKQTQKSEQQNNYLIF